MQGLLACCVGRAPLGLSWRCHYWFTTFVIAIGIGADLLIYSVLIPVLPFRLEHLGYDKVASLVGYMLFAYSGGLVVSTLPVAWYSERYESRKGPLNLGMILMIGCQFILMFSPKYWPMVLARALQGVGGSMIWVAGIALVCDVSPPQYLGRQIGVTMAGFSAGIVMGPAIGGALYDKFGWHGALVFGTIALSMDFIGRLLIIDRKTALRYGIDPRIIKPKPKNDSQAEKASSSRHESESLVPSTPRAVMPHEAINVVRPEQLPFLSVLVRMSKSPRALAPLACTMIYGLVVTAQETTAPLHVNAIWGLNSTKVGLVFLAGAIPPLFTSPLVGWLSDRYGVEWVLPMVFFVSVPWLCLFVIEKWLALFIVTFSIAMSITGPSVAPIMAELAAVANHIDGVGYAHVYGVFNLVYGIGSAIGPLIGGQIYEHSKDGWLIICIVCACLCALAGAITFCISGNKPLLARLRGLLSRDAKGAQQETPLS